MNRSCKWLGYTPQQYSGKGNSLVHPPDLFPPRGLALAHRPFQATLISSTIIIYLHHMNVSSSVSLIVPLVPLHGVTNTQSTITTPKSVYLRVCQIEEELMLQQLPASSQGIYIHTWIYFARVNGLAITVNSALSQEFHLHTLNPANSTSHARGYSLTQAWNSHM